MEVNDFETLKVAEYSESIYFYVKTVDNIVVGNKWTRVGLLDCKIEDNELIVKIPIKMVIQRHMVG